MEDDFRLYSRIGYFSPFDLLEIAYDSLETYLILEKKIAELKDRGTFEHDKIVIFNEHDAIDEASHKLLKETIKSVIFLGAFLESYFFEYAATALGQGYTEKYIEKIGLTAKIILIPRLVTGKEINRELSFWSGISDLIKWRNKIVHNKTKDAFDYFKSCKKYDPKSFYEKFDLKTIFNSVKDLFEELDKIDPKGLHLFKFGLKKRTKTQQ